MSILDRVRGRISRSETAEPGPIASPAAPPAWMSASPVPSVIPPTRVGAQDGLHRTLTVRRTHTVLEAPGHDVDAGTVGLATGLATTTPVSATVGIEGHRQRPIRLGARALVDRHRSRPASGPAAPPESGAGGVGDEGRLDQPPDPVAAPWVGRAEPAPTVGPGPVDRSVADRGIGPAGSVEPIRSPEPSAPRGAPGVPASIAVPGSIDRTASPVRPHRSSAPVTANPVAESTGPELGGSLPGAGGAQPTGTPERVQRQPARETEDLGAGPVDEAPSPAAEPNRTGSTGPAPIDRLDLDDGLGPPLPHEVRPVPPRQRPAPGPTLGLGPPIVSRRLDTALSDGPAATPHNRAGSRDATVEPERQGPDRVAESGGAIGDGADVAQDQPLFLATSPDQGASAMTTGSEPTGSGSEPTGSGSEPTGSGSEPTASPPDIRSVDDMRAPAGASGPAAPIPLDGRGGQTLVDAGSGPPRRGHETAVVARAEVTSQHPDASSRPATPMTVQPSLAPDVDRRPVLGRHDPSTATLPMVTRRVRPEPDPPGPHEPGPLAPGSGGEAPAPVIEHRPSPIRTGATLLQRAVTGPQGRPSPLMPQPPTTPTAPPQPPPPVVAIEANDQQPATGPALDLARTEPMAAPFVTTREAGTLPSHQQPSPPQAEPDDLDGDDQAQLADQLYQRIERRLRSELLGDLERRGQIAGWI